MAHRATSSAAVSASMACRMRPITGFTRISGPLTPRLLVNSWKLVSSDASGGMKPTLRYSDDTTSTSQWPRNMARNGSMEWLPVR